MLVYLVFIENNTIPIGVFDTFQEAQKIVFGNPSKHCYIYQYKINDYDNKIKVLDNYSNKL